MLHSKDQMFPICAEVDLWLCFAFHWGGVCGRAQYKPIDTLSWFNVVFGYRDHGSRLYSVTFGHFQIKLLKFF